MSVDDLLIRNQAWAASQVQTDPEFFTRQIAGQAPRLLWIGCADSRVPAERILDCGPGELFIHRNVANIVAYNDINIAAVIQYATQRLNVPDIVVCGHYGCGGVAAACANWDLGGYIGDWLFIAEGAKRAVDAQLQAEQREVPHDEFLQLVVEANVRLQVGHLARLSVVRQSRARPSGLPRLHGWVYDLATGLIKIVVDGRLGDQVNAST
jgi:carbonic anhydrase